MNNILVVKAAESGMATAVGAAQSQRWVEVVVTAENRVGVAVTAGLGLESWLRPN